MSDDRKRAMAANEATAAGQTMPLTPGDETQALGPAGVPESVGGQPDGEPDGWVGQYRLVRLLAEGGMGEVWLAEQSAPLRRQLAIKVIKRGMDTREFVARFESERQALALMDHPCIAKVFDAGATPRGRPFFAMEYVAGEPIVDHCDDRSLHIDERLQLFLKVCQGVQHAHQKAIIHRDLKPSNVLVSVHDGEAVPKIIDFGVAKALGDGLTGNTMQTHLGQIVGTLDYMSPEQADLSDVHVDTRTDVYALGVLLFELLVGRRPLESSTLADAGLVEILRRIREDEPTRPTARLTELDAAAAAVIARERGLDPAGLTRRLRGDLDWITLRALEKDRTRRYASVGELAADIQRHLRDEPVLAGPPSRRYHVRKFVRRHRTVVFGSVLGLALVLMGIAGTSIGLVRARQAERLARSEALTAQQVSIFLESMFEVSDPDRSRGETITAREILASGTERIEDQLEGQPVTMARLLHTMGRVYHKLGLYDEAEPQLARALDVRERLLADHGSVQQSEVAANKIDLAELYTVQARWDEAATLLRESMQMFADGGPEHRLQLASALSKLASVYRRQGRYPEAQPLYEQAREIREQALGPAAPEVAESYNSLAILAYYQGDWKRAEEFFRAALAIRQQTLGTDHPDIAQTLNNLGLIMQAQGDFAGAIPLYAEAAAVWERTLGPDHVRLALVYNNLGLAHYELGDLAVAEPHLERALDIRERALGPDNPDVAQTLQNLANLNRDRGDFERAEVLYRRALAVREASLGPDHADVGWTMTGLAGLFAATGQPDLAVQEMSRALAVLEGALGPDFPELADRYEDYATYLDQAGRTDAALAARQRAAPIIRNVEPHEGETP